MDTQLHNPLPLIDYTFRDLPWRTRLRRNLALLNLEAEFPDHSNIDLIFTKDEVDKALDQAFWEGGNIFNRVRALLNGYIQSTDPQDTVKAGMLSKALDITFAGHAKSIHNVNKWRTYAARVAVPRQAPRTELVLFQAESDDMAMDLVLNALLKMEEYKASMPSYIHEWTLVKLFYKTDDKYYISSSVTDVDLTSLFWEKAGGLMSCAPA